MAQLYTRVYAYTKQTLWSMARRSIPFSEFSVSGATDKNIGQIVSIRCESCHSSSTSWTWTLTDRLVLANGKTFDSDPVTHYISKSAQVWFSCSFSNLPTTEEFAQISEVQILDNSGSVESNGKLTWKAFSERPIYLYVDFYDQPPVKYAPQISEFEVERWDSNNQTNAEGTTIATTLKLAFAEGTPTDQVAVKLYTSTNPATLGDESNLLEKVSIGELISGISLRTGVIDGQYSAGNTFYFTVVVSIGSESDSKQRTAFRAKAPIHITNNGVSFGGFSSATESDPKEEFYNPVVFHNGFSVGAGNDILTSIGIRAGNTAKTSVDDGKFVDVPITFTPPFADGVIPVVVTGFLHNSEGGVFGRCSCSTLTGSVTNVGCSIRVYNYSGSNRTPALCWIAIG